MNTRLQGGGKLMRHGKLRPGTAANKYKDALRKRVARRDSLGDADSNRDRVDQPVYQLPLRKTMIQFVSQLFPSSVEKACSQRGALWSRASQRKRTLIGEPLNVSFAKNVPTPSTKYPFTGGSSEPG